MANQVLKLLQQKLQQCGHCGAIKTVEFIILFNKYLLLLNIETDDNYSIWFEISNNSSTIRYDSVQNEKNTICTPLAKTGCQEHIIVFIRSTLRSPLNIASLGVRPPVVYCPQKVFTISTKFGMYSVSQKKSPPRGPDIFSFFFTNGWEFLIDFYTHIKCSYLR